MRNTLIGITCLALLMACQEVKNKQDGRSVFRYNEAAGITSLDPAFANNQANIWAVSQLYNGLVRLDSSLSIIPDLAKYWTISEDGRTYRFYLRTDVFFHRSPLHQKSRRLVASDVVYSFKRIASEKTLSPGIWIFDKVRKEENGLLALNDSTLQIQLTEAYPPFLGLLASAYCLVIAPEAVEKYGADYRKNPLGTGPFRFYRWEERVALIFHKHEDYFETDAAGKRLPYLDAVMISFISDKQSAFLDFLVGKLDFLNGLDASYKDDLLTNTGELKSKYRSKFIMETGPYLNTEYLGFLYDSSLSSAKNQAINDPRIRKAISLGFDRKEMITYLRNNMAEAGSGGFVPPGLPGFDSVAAYGYSYEPERASHLLSEAGYPQGKGLPEIVLSTTHSYLDLCEYIQGSLSRIGIKVRIETNQAAQHRQMVARQQLYFFRGSWIADYADAENYLSLFLEKNKAPKGPNYTHFSEPATEAIFTKAMQTIDDSVRYALYRQMDSTLMQEAPVVVLYYDKVLRLKQNTVSGLGMNPMNTLDLRKVEINPLH